MTPEEYAALKALVDELLALTKGGDDLSGVVIPDDFAIEDVPKPEKGYSKGQYIAEMVNRQMKADEARAAEWGDIVDGHTATKAFARLAGSNGGDVRSPTPTPTRGSCWARPCPASARRFARVCRDEELIKHKGKGNVQFVLRDQRR